MREKKYSIGIDYGTNSVRAVVVDIRNGNVVGEDVFAYPSGNAGVIVDAKNPNQARQNPADYVQGLRTVLKKAVQDASLRDPEFRPDAVAGIGTDTTASTPIPVDAEGIPVAFQEEFKNDPDACAWLWKDHTSIEEAKEITRWASECPENFTSKCGGTYSSEWYWAKILHCVRTAPRVAAATASWVELADFVPGWLTGKTAPDVVPRGICTAGHKALYHESWGGLPSVESLARLDERLCRFRYASKAVSVNQKVGTLLPEIALEVGLPPETAVAVGAIDCHLGAIGCGIRPGMLIQTMGTSTCDIMVAPIPENQPELAIPGLCGIVPGSVLPGMFGFEAGQAAVGDLFNWFVENLTPTAFTADGNPHAALTEEAARLAPGASGLLALDWSNGNRTILGDQDLTGLLIGQTIRTTAPEVFRALIEATAFGARMIISQFEKFGVRVEEVVNCGGIADKNDFIMQIYADVCDRPMKVSRSSQTCALGAAITGAVAGGAYDSYEAAFAEMTGVREKVFQPRPDAVKVYDRLFRLYSTLHDAFGKTGKVLPMAEVMKELIAIRRETR